MICSHAILEASITFKNVHYWGLTWGQTTFISSHIPAKKQKKILFNFEVFYITWVVVVKIVFDLLSCLLINFAKM